MTEDNDLKRRIHGNETISVAFGRPDMPPDAVKDFVAAGHDMVFIDCQHQPVDEKELAKCCKMSSENGLPVAVRIKHPDEAHMIGRYLDFGALSIVVPMVEREDTVVRAIESFYFPPVGRRSWGPDNAYGWSEHRSSYADWWNCNGILMLQFESLKAVLGADKLIKPGVDIVVFGENDLMLDISATPDAPLHSFQECREHVLKITAGMDVKIAASNSPIGRL